MNLNNLNILLNERRYYTGVPLESGGTSIKSGTGASPAVKEMFNSGIIKNGMVVLDFGSGKYNRNSNYLREQGIKVYSYDPFNGQTESSGWDSTAKTFPRNIKFDLAFTSYVLNVVPYNVEKNIITQMVSLSKKQAHIVRDDVVTAISKPLKSSAGTNPAKQFFVDEYAKHDEELIQKMRDGKLSKEEITDFCIFGVKTVRGFQRLVYLEENGYTLTTKKTGKYRIYLK